MSGEQVRTRVPKSKILPKQNTSVPPYQQKPTSKKQKIANGLSYRAQAQ